MTTPIANIDNTTLLNLTPNLDIGDVADPALRLAYFQYLNVYIQTITTAYNAFVASGAVGTVNLADLSVITAKIADLAITTGKIADLAVTTAKLNNMAVTLAKMATDSVGTTQLVNSSVTTSKIADGAVTGQKLDPALLLTNITLNMHRLSAVLDHPDGSVTDAKLDSGVTGVKYRFNALELQDAQILANPYQLTKTLNKMLSGVAVKGITEGDSTTYGDTGAGRSTSPWPETLQTKLRSIYSNNNITIVNKGGNGTRSDQGLARLQADIIAENPDFCTIMFGINDASGFVLPTNTLAQYRANLIAMVKMCYSYGVEVLIMSPTPSYGLLTGWTHATNRKIFMYGKAAEEVAKAYNTGFFNLHDTLEKLYQSKSDSPALVMSIVDYLHYSNYGYVRISELIASNVFDLRKNETLSIDSTNDVGIAVAGNKYIDSDVTFVSAAAAGLEFYGTHYSLASDSSVGTFINFEFLVTQKGMDLIFVAPKNPASGRVAVYDNGANVGIYDCYAQENTIFEVENIVIENMAIGYHKIELKVANMTTGASVATPYYVSISAFKFSKTKARNDLLYNTGAGVASLEAFKDILNSPTLRFKAPASYVTGVILMDADSVQLKNLKTLVYEVEGKFFDGLGISWFGEKAGVTNALGLAYGYVLNITAAGLNLYHPTGSNNAASLLGSWASVLTLPATTHTLRFEISYLGVIKVYWDGNVSAAITTAASLKVREGYFGLQAVNPASLLTAEIKRWEYCYI